MPCSAPGPESWISAGWSEGWTLWGELLIICFGVSSPIGFPRPAHSLYLTLCPSSGDMQVGSMPGLLKPQAECHFCREEQLVSSHNLKGGLIMLANYTEIRYLFQVGTTVFLLDWPPNDYPRLCNSREDWWFFWSQECNLARAARMPADAAAASASSAGPASTASSVVASWCSGSSSRQARLSSPVGLPGAADAAPSRWHQSVSRSSLWADIQGGRGSAAISLDSNSQGHLAAMWVWRGSGF